MCTHVLLYLRASLHIVLLHFADQWSVSDENMFVLLGTKPINFLKSYNYWLYSVAYGITVICGSEH